MSESVSFKAYLKRDGQEVEVRRFGIDSGAATNFFYLQGKIQSVFPSIKNDQFSLFWQDADNDYVSVSSDEELLEALTASSTRPFKLYIKPVKQQQSQAPGEGPIHPGITCDSCNGPVVGRRYKCVTCADYDLCSTCEAAGRHSEHFLLRISSPMGPLYPKFMRKMFGRPHKFFKHGMGELRRCPMERERERPREGRGPSGTTDMFDFSALMEFINSLGLSMAAGQREGGQPDGAEQQGNASASAPPRQQAGAAPQQAGATPQQAGAAPQQAGATPQPSTAATDYLSHLGQAITDFLDPFGVDVSFEVRPKTTETHESGPAPTPKNGATQPTPSPSTSAFQTAPSTTQSAPAPASNTTQSAPAPAPSTTTGATQPAPSTGATQPPTPRSTGSPAPLFPELREAATARRNSDDWTMLNRESPTRGTEAAAMEVEGATNILPFLYPLLPKETPEEKKIQEAIDMIRYMGFNFDTTMLKEMLKKENCDIASVLEHLLSNKK